MRSIHFVRNTVTRLVYGIAAALSLYATLSLAQTQTPLADATQPVVPEAVQRKHARGVKDMPVADVRAESARRAQQRNEDIVHYVRGF